MSSSPPKPFIDRTPRLAFSLKWKAPNLLPPSADKPFISWQKLAAESLLPVKEGRVG